MAHLPPRARGARSRSPLAPLSLALLLGACGGSGNAGGRMELTELSIQNGVTWPLNRPIDFTFSEPVDFASVNSSTIAIRQLDGTPAIGSFRMKEPNVVRFQPRCPLRPDLSDAGLQPSPSVGERIRYTISVAGGSELPGVRSLDGASLEQGQPVVFFTPLADAALDQLFVDTALGGPQPLVRGLNAPLDALVACRVELGGDPTRTTYFRVERSGEIVLEGELPLPLNLYSDPSSRPAVVLELDQALDPSAENISAERVRLEFERTPDAGDWRPLAIDLALVENCSSAGASLRIAPRGILPQDRRLRVVLGSDLRDIVGGTNPNAIATLPMRTSLVDVSAIDPLEPHQGADEVFEDFVLGAPAAGSLEDAGAAFLEARASWGGGQLIAGFPFDGTGGPGGNFDLHVQPGSPVVFNTITTSFFGGPDGVVTATQVAVNGRLDVRDLVVPEGATLRIEGPNPALILATGSVRVDGRILATGGGNRGVVTLNTAHVPEPGAAGQAGGGRGGAGSPLTTQHSPRGQRGFGAFDVPGGGGEGGESGYSAGPGDGVNQRRAGGGGGGALGADVIDPAPQSGCSASPPRPDNNVVGLDAEQGFPGGQAGFGALHPGQRAQGGLPGQRPFFDPDPTNDFYGRMITAAGETVAGELARPWAGAGGGGGGDAIQGNTFAGASFGSARAEKGAGGGGGGGSLRILALGDVVLGPRGAIDVGGGAGGGGENTANTNRVGGGSGGGSGGHLVIECAGRIDLSAVLGTLPFSSESAPDVGLRATGGQGGAGKDNFGGSAANPGQPTLPCKDAVAASSCPVPGGQPAVDGAGGDGGPGLIQLHLGSLADLVPPAVGRLFHKGQRLTGAGSSVTCAGAGNGNALKNDGVIKPPPVGSPADVKMANDTNGWARLVPSFGQLSRARSVWIPFGEAGARPGGAPAEAVELLFDGVDVATGAIRRHPFDPTRVDELPPILGRSLGSGSILAVTNQARTAVVSGLGLSDDVWARNPRLLRGCLLRVFPAGGGAPHELDLAGGSYDAALDRFALTADASGQPLLGLAGSDFELRPRFFRVVTGGVPDRLPTSASVRIEFQAAARTLSGAPDELATSPWTADVTTLNGEPAWRFVRFRVLFDLQADGTTPLDASTPKPALDLLKLPFRF